MANKMSSNRSPTAITEAPDGVPLGQLLPEMAAEDAPAEVAITIPAALGRRAAWTSTFLASLPLAGEGKVDLGQEGLFAPIHVYRALGWAPEYVDMAPAMHPGDVDVLLDK
jgi:hypothetical protein